MKSLLIKTGSLGKSWSSKVLFYHDIHVSQKYTPDSTHLDFFKQQINFIRSCGYTFSAGIPENSHQVLLTFDDGYKGIYEQFEYFEKEKIPVKIFLVTNKINNANYLSDSQIKELASSGLVTFG